MVIDLQTAFESEPPTLDFIWPGFLAGTVGALVAPGATGKSFWALEAAMSIACSSAGGDLVGLNPTHTGRVIYLAGEDPPAALVCRVHAIGKHLVRQAREIIMENLTLEPIMGQRMNVMDSRHLARIIDFCGDARLIVLDTLSRIHCLDENSNGDMARLVGTLEHVASSTGAAILYLHHVSKGSAREFQTDQQQAARSYGGIWVTRRDQAARLWVASDCATPSLNLTPSMTRGNWLVPLSLRHFFEAARIKVKTISLAVFCDNAPLVRTVR
ncbi:hypothetical protein ACMV_09950 [Acidiphilium multivorum AIU301]|uniref:Replication protein A n=2 Tax=Acidiphilium multivorum TaxID=62140 RepID=F0J686_ACIMA|nr:hypothetical protein ACMV_09950 [Acidiphilium multivorum AIU301]